MGDRANVHVKYDNDDNGVFLYTHWDGSELPGVLQKVITQGKRLDDCQYLTRIIFDTMTEGCHGEEAGFGISAFCGDGEGRVLIVNCEEQTVSRNEQSWSFDEFAGLSKEEIEGVWDV